AREFSVLASQDDPASLLLADLGDAAAEGGGLVGMRRYIRIVDADDGRHRRRHALAVHGTGTAHFDRSDSNRLGVVDTAIGERGGSDQEGQQQQLVHGRIPVFTVWMNYAASGQATSAGISSMVA